MKKYLVIVFLCSFVLFGCTKRSSSRIDVATINDLSTLQVVVTQVSEEMNAGTLNIEQAEDLLNKLQQKYLDLTDVPQQDIENQFETIEKSFEAKAISLYTLPFWAKRLGMTVPKGMELDKTASKHSSENDDVYSSTTLVYKGNYTIAMQQAEAIAQKAHLVVSKSFQQAQSLAKVGDIDYISGLDIGRLTKGIVYMNHELLDTHVDELLSVSVDQNGILTLEATKYK